MACGRRADNRAPVDSIEIKTELQEKWVGATALRLPPPRGVC